LTQPAPRRAANNPPPKIIQLERNAVMGMLQEFREFAVKGNAMDLAVGVIIGGAFGKIVDSIVGDLIMPLVSACGRPPGFLQPVVSCSATTRRT
jgi:hypothetical protein